MDLKNRISLLKNYLTEETIELCHRHDIQMICIEEEDYPKFLKTISKAPPILFVKGMLPSEEILANSFALVGTRKPSLQGEDFAREIGRYMKEKNIFHISGLARGIDTIGHQETLGNSGAILGQGLLTAIYPRENKYLAEQIVDTGGFLLSELAPYESVSRFSLLQRNRLQSALTFGIIIAETNLQGGTLQTFRYARAQKKEIYVASFNKEFIEKYEKDIHVLEDVEELEKKRKSKWLQQHLFSW